MKIMTILGTRPEIIRLVLIIKKLDKLCEHILIHTGQNYDPRLKDIFFEDLELRMPDVYLAAQAPTMGVQISIILKEIEKQLIEKKPDRILILGDTNSGLAAIIAERMGIPVYHMEAGNRCFDLKVPEEVNRKIIDAVSSIAIPYTPGSRENLLREGLPKNRIFVSGNPINEVLNAYKEKIEKSQILNQLGISQGQYFLVTAHRSENVDIKERLEQIMLGLEKIANKYQLPIICSIHPRTKSKLEKYNLNPKNPLIRLSEPFGFFDFVKLEKNARLVLSDSGTVQEECCIFHVPTVTLRDTTERPETLDCGSNIIAKVNAENILNCVHIMLNSPNEWELPIGYGDLNVADRIVRILLGGNLNV
jgi:UDP-N-acetylglucosamine 2-epimerase (non-hydrolysing)